MINLDEINKLWEQHENAQNARRIAKIEEEVAEIRKKLNRDRLNSQLKPCPFCGGKAVIINETEYAGGCHYETVCVKCVDCGASTCRKVSDGYYELYCSDEEIAEMWNRRVGE